MISIVTGGAGFIGSHLVDRLIKLKHKVIVLDNLSTGRIENIKQNLNNIKFINCDLSKIGDWKIHFKKADYVFHLAALADLVPSINNPIKYFHANVIGTLNILKLSKDYKIKKLIYTASSSCYGIPKNYPTNENENIDMRHPYALTKRMGEELILHWSKVYKVKSISLRLFNVYGTRSRTSSNYGAMFGVFLSQKIKQKPYTVVKDGNQLRDFLYVSDVVDAIVRAAKSKIYGEIFNVGSGCPVSVLDIVNLLKGKYVFIPKRPGEPDITHADIKKIKKYLQWKPKISIKKGINILLQNIDYWKSAPLWTPKNIKVATKDWFKYLK
jgi:UDP-glucose 4-epimerase